MNKNTARKKILPEKRLNIKASIKVKRQKYKVHV